MTAAPSPVPSLIAIDWGTTNRRGYLLNHEGIILDSYFDGDGLTNIRDEAYQASLKILAAPWVAQWGSLPILMSGMIGASTGWVDAGYCPVPVGIQELSENLVRVPGNETIWIVPGVSTLDKAGIPDVIRGEEVQSLSVSGKHNDAVVITPGTHSKWVRVEGQRITWFTTFLTGDLFDAILNHTVISVLQRPGDMGGEEAFCRGVEIGFAEHANLMHVLFGARTNVLFNKLLPEEVSHYLSGLLIGAEIATGVSIIGNGDTALILLGSDNLTQRYQLAFATCGINVDIANLDSVSATYLKISRLAGL